MSKYSNFTYPEKKEPLVDVTKAAEAWGVEGEWYSEH